MVDERPLHEVIIVTTFYVGGTVISVLLSFFGTHLLIYFIFAALGLHCVACRLFLQLQHPGSLVMVGGLVALRHVPKPGSNSCPCTEGEFLTSVSSGKSPVSSFHT